MIASKGASSAELVWLLRFWLDQMFHQMGDHTTYNLVQYLGELGAEIVVYRNDHIDVSGVESSKPRKIVISPGPGVPDNAGVTLELIDRFTGRVPILGVCLGHQAIGQVFGGKVVPAPYLMHGKISQIHHDHRTIFQGLPDGFPATRYHSLMVEKESLPPCLEISATSADGLIMGLRHREVSVEGAQFHPDSVLTTYGKTLPHNFLRL